MGVEARVVLYAADAGGAALAARAAFERLAELDDSMSDYRPESEVSKLAAAAGGAPASVSPDLFRVLEAAMSVSHESGGAFDVTVGPLSAVWREARRTSRLPEENAIAAASVAVGWRDLELDPQLRTARLRRRGMKLDLGGIAKGYAAQEAVELLYARGVTRCMVSLAGDIVAGDAPPGAAGWRVSANPHLGGALPAADLLIANQAVSTSGDAQQYLEVGHRHYSHIIDPRSGEALTNRLAVTVIAPRGELADAWASAACVLGRVQSIPMLGQHEGTAAIFDEVQAEGPVVRTCFDTRSLLSSPAPPAVPRPR